MVCIFFTCYVIQYSMKARFLDPMNLVRYPRRMYSRQRADFSDADVSNPCTLVVFLMNCTTSLIAFPLSSHHYGNRDFTRIPWTSGLFPSRWSQRTHQRRAEPADDLAPSTPSEPTFPRTRDEQYACRPYIRNGFTSPPKRHFRSGENDQVRRQLIRVGYSERFLQGIYVCTIPRN